jgi:hypothetical protein
MKATSLPSGFTVAKSEEAIYGLTQETHHFTDERRTMHDQQLTHASFSFNRHIIALTPA